MIYPAFIYIILHCSPPARQNRGEMAIVRLMIHREAERLEASETSAVRERDAGMRDFNDPHRLLCIYIHSVTS